MFGWPNRFLSSVLTASNQEAALPVTNLANDQGSADQAWQCPATSGWVRLDAGAVVPFRLVSLHNSNLTAAATVRVRAWIGADTSAAPAWDSGVLPGAVVAGYRQALVMLPAGASGRTLQIDIADPGNPDGFLNVAQAFAGPAWQPVRNFNFQSAPGRTAQLAKTATRSGGVVIRPDWVKRVFALSLSGIKAAEVLPRVMDLDLYARRGNNVLFVPNPDSPTRNQEVLFGEFEPSSNVTYPYQTADARGYAATLTERL